MALQLAITGTTFSYTNGYSAPFTSVQINYLTSGEDGLNLNGSYQITPEDYSAAIASDDGFLGLVKNKLLADINSIELPDSTTTTTIAPSTTTTTSTSTPTTTSTTAAG